MLRRHFFALFAAALTVAATAQAQSNHIQITVPRGGKETVSLTFTVGGDQGALFRQTLQRDLERSGYFTVIPEGGRTRVEGSAIGSGTLTTALTVSWPGKRFAWNHTTADVRLLAHTLSDEMVRHITNNPGMATSTLAAVRRGGPRTADLYTFDYDGANIRRITNDNAAIVGVRWAPDLQNLYFTSYRTGHGAIHRAHLPNGKISALAHFKGFNAGAMPSPTDPTKIALILSHQGNPELYILDSRTGGLTRLTNTKTGSEASPCWSPDGTRIVYVSDAATRTPQLFVVDVATRQSRRLTYSGSENVSPDWGSNGLIAFATRRGAPYQIALIDPNKGEASTRILTPKNDTCESPTWAPDGRHIAYSRTQGKTAAIYVLDAHEGSTDKPWAITPTTQGDWVYPAWSPRKK